MSCWKLGQAECTSANFCSFISRLANLATLCAIAFVGWGSEISLAQVSDAEKASYADALAYCPGDVARPMSLRTHRLWWWRDRSVCSRSQCLSFHCRGR